MKIYFWHTSLIVQLTKDIPNAKNVRCFNNHIQFYF